MPERGTLITVAPAPGPIGRLLRTAIDAEQVGATRLVLSSQQPELPAAISALREQTRLILTSESDVAGLDQINSGFADLLVEETADLPALVAQVARHVAGHPSGVSLRSTGACIVPVVLAALAAGGHLTVESTAHDHAALVARASGLARIAGRPPLDRVAARDLLGT